MSRRKIHNLETDGKLRLIMQHKDLQFALGNTVYKKVYLPLNVLIASKGSNHYILLEGARCFIDHGFIGIFYTHICLLSDF